ncbi:MAG: hypothetical protein A2Y10_13905 [Planctomycetes bacterium GWF2_41_51]|nr:MAG: hypothetical protein A2Y10_13905 [Planctomycetes bacterium GWF2_41_51]
MKKINKLSIVTVVILFTAAGILFLLKDFQTYQQQSPMPVSISSAEAVSQHSGGDAGTGFSIAEDTKTAVKEAIDMALAQSGKNQADFCIILASSKNDFPLILTETKQILGNNIKIFGGTSGSGSVMTEQGYLKAGIKNDSGIPIDKTLTVMTISTKDIVFGTASADLGDSNAVHDAAATVVKKAIEDAGKTIENKPKVILLYVGKGIEEETIKGIESVTGKDVPIFGGTAGGPKRIVMSDEGAYERGISATVIYTDLPIGLSFEAGYDIHGKHSGVVTKVTGQNIEEIDGRPAMTVYNEWMDGEIERLAKKEMKKPAEIEAFLALHPFYRKLTSSEGQDYYLFTRPWPKDPSLVNKFIQTNTKIMPQEKIYISHGTWDTLMNRMGIVASSAKMHCGLEPADKPLLVIGVICDGMMGCIPEEEKSKFPYLINYSTGSDCTIAAFTSGEQGHFPGVGNRHGNLATSFLVIGSGKKNK